MHRPLAGYRVFDMTTATAGPFCAAQLADFGAEVIHIESPEADVTRRLWPSFDGTSTTYWSYNRNKKSMILNLKDPEGLELAKELLKTCDILVENNRPGVMDRLGLSYEAVKAIRPDIIYASISGFGQTGPYRQRAAYDGIIQAMSGFMSLTGPAGGEPTKAGPSIADLISGLYAAFGISIAVIQRERTGEGCQVDCSMLDTFTAMSENAIAAYLNAGAERGPMGNLHPQSAIFGTVHVKDGEIMLCMQKQTQHQKLFALLGLPDLTQEERFSSSIERRRHVDELMAIVEEKTKAYTKKELTALLVEAGLPAGEIYTVPELLRDEQVRFRGHVIPVHDAKNKEGYIYGQPLAFSNIETPKSASAAQAGEHNLEIMTQLLGLPLERAEQLDRQMRKGR